MAFEIGRGTNISHWLSQSKNRGAQRRDWFTRADIERIAGWGFDHIRLPIDEEQMWDESMRRDQEAFDLLAGAIDWCATNRLAVVLDLHILRSHYFNDADVPALYNDAGARERFAAIWSDLAGFVEAVPDDRLAVELLNEAVAPSAHVWNETWRVAYDAVRAHSATRTIVLGSNNFNSYDTVSGLDVPADPNLILTFHYYHPMFVTHHTAKWWRQGGSYAGPIRYPGRPIPESQHRALEHLKDDGIEQLNRDFDIDVMRRDMGLPRSVADRTGHRLYCGEFGCYEHTPSDIREAWYRDVATVLSELGIAWANWDYKGSFGLVDKNGQETGVRRWLLEER